MNNQGEDQTWQEVLGLWFPEDRLFDLDVAAGRYTDWTSVSGGRLALIIVLDQFSRSLWRDSARAFAQDTAALALTMEGLSDGILTATIF